MPIWRWSGPIVIIRPKPGTSWFRYVPQRFFCRSCGIELRSVLGPLGYVTMLLTIGLTLAVGFLVLRYSPIATFNRYIAAIALTYVLSIFALCLVQLRWGTTFKLPPKAPVGGQHAL
jgi:hypothetical protein